jgi:hypothetical protein
MPREPTSDDYEEQTTKTLIVSVFLAATRHTATVGETKDSPARTW